MRKRVVYNDYPFWDVAKQVDVLLKNNDNCDIHQKFTCANCGERLTIEQPNVMHKIGTCDKCNHVTNIEQQGCNYLVIHNLRQGKDDASASHESKTGDSDWLSSKHRK